MTTESGGKMKSEERLTTALHRDSRRHLAASRQIALVADKMI